MPKYDFNVGDTVEGNHHHFDSHSKQAIVIRNGNRNDEWIRIRFQDGYEDGYKPVKLTVIKGNQVNTTRRTFRLLRDMPNTKKGALYQEQCDDGTQPYQLITPEFKRFEDNALHVFTNRDVVETQPQWFEEVFATQPPFMNKAEIEDWEAFKANKKSRTTKSKKK